MFGGDLERSGASLCPKADSAMGSNQDAQGFVQLGCDDNLLLQVSRVGRSAGPLTNKKGLTGDVTVKGNQVQTQEASTQRVEAGTDNLEGI